MNCGRKTHLRDRVLPAPRQPPCSPFGPLQVLDVRQDLGALVDRVRVQLLLVGGVVLKVVFIFITACSTCASTPSG
jgi:hypothetical protein